MLSIVHRYKKRHILPSVAVAQKTDIKIKNKPL